MKKQHRRFRWAFALAAVATLAVGCGSGLLDTEDKALPNSEVQMTLAKALDGTAGSNGTATLTITLLNGKFSENFKKAAQAKGSLSDFITLADSTANITLTSITADDKVTAPENDTKWGVNKDDGTYTMYTETVTATLGYTAGGAANGTVQLELKSGAIEGITATRIATAGRYAFVKGENVILTPDVASMNAVIALKKETSYAGKLVAAARISLESPTENENQIAKGAEIGSGTAGETLFTVYAATDIPKGSGNLSLAIVSDEPSSESSYKGFVSFTFTADGITKKEFKYDDASRFWVPYYAEDFSSVTNVNIADYAENATLPDNTIMGCQPPRSGSVIMGTIEKDADYGSYFRFNMDEGGGISESGNRGSATAVSFGVPAATASNAAINTTVEFDASIKLGNIANRSESGIAVTTKALDSTTVAAMQKTDVCFAAYTETNDSATAVVSDFIVPGATTTYAIPNAVWCHYKLTVTETYNTAGNTYVAKVTITNKSTDAIIANNISVTCSGRPEAIQLFTARGRGVNCLDNIFVYSTSE